MKRRITFALIFTVLFGCGVSAVSESVSSKQWMLGHFAQGAAPPFSFKYAGHDSDSFMKNWTFDHQEKQIDDARTQHIFTYTDPRTNLEIRAECILYSDFPAVEWVLRIRNNSDKDSPILEDIQALDTTFAGVENGGFLLHHALGSSASREDFAPMDTPIGPGDPIRFSPAGGRSSDVNSLPFFNMETSSRGGVMLGIGWSGQWAAAFSREDATSVRVRAGMALTHLKLYPHEVIRTPRILLVFWEGDDYLAGQNMFRRIILKHYSPQKDGKPATLPFAFSVHGVYPFNETTEQNMVDLAGRAMEKLKNTGIEYFWIDAGWYEGGWPDGVGNNYPDPKRYPNGLRPVSAAAEKNGLKFLLWIEPERVHVGTWLDRERPKWVLKTLRHMTTGLLNLGNKDARRWLTDTISGLIDEGISVYRQDFNMDPIDYWKSADKKTRQGITEIRHVEGLYEFWDELLRRRPGLLIDNCASGGRRLDLETVSRSVALWRTDYDPFEPEGYQSHTYGISLWLPTTSIGTDRLDAYGFRSSMNNGLVLAWNPTAPDFPVEQAERLAAEFQRARGFFFGDFYPLTKYSTASNVWIAFQFHREDLREGMIQAFRRKDKPEPELRVNLRSLSPGADYELTFAGENIKKVYKGKDLTDSFVITLKNPRDSALIFYRQL